MAARRAAEADEACNCFAFRKATRRVTQLYDQALAPIGLRATQYTLLIQVDTHGPIALMPLASILVMDRATLGHNLRPLEARSLVSIGTGQDRRSRLVSTTVSGRELVAHARTLWLRAQRAFEAEFGAAASAELRRMLAVVAGGRLVLR